MENIAKTIFCSFIVVALLVVAVFFMYYILILIPALNNIVFCILYGIVAGFLIGSFMARLIHKNRSDKD